MPPFTSDPYAPDRVQIGGGRGAASAGDVTRVMRYAPRYFSAGLTGLPDDWKPSRQVNTPDIYELLAKARRARTSARGGPSTSGASARW
eukprot:6860624-Prymnesium_polylepis.3